MTFVRRAMKRTVGFSTFVLAAVLAQPALAQEVFAGRVVVDFDRPEAWAMKYFASVTAMSSFGPRRLSAGELELQLEVGQVPDLSTRQRTVGFNGFKEEDLNRSPALARPRLAVGVGGGVVVTAGVVPPLEIDGVKALVLSLALDRSFSLGRRADLGLGFFAEQAQIEGDFTCTANDVAFPPGSAENGFGCETVSEDEVDFDTYGVRAGLGFELPWREARLHVGATHRELDGEFMVNAQTFGFFDRTSLVTDGSLQSYAAGISWRLWAKSRLGAELFYAPLHVNRPDREGIEGDDLVQLRLLASFRLGRH